MMEPEEHTSPVNNANDADEEDELEQAMLAFQEQQQQQDDDAQDDDLVEDDHNVFFLQDDEEEEHPNANNPAAVALRARLEQNRRLLNAQSQPSSLLQRISSCLHYTPLSFGAAIFLIFHTMRTRQQFYLTIMYLQSSKLSYIVLGNAIIAMAVSTFRTVIKLFLGGLRVNERDAIGEHVRWDVTETCLALTIFRSEMDVGTAVRFLGLVVMKCLHWSVELRGSHLRMTEEVFIYPEQETVDTDNNQRKKLSWYKHLPHFRMSHLRYYSLLYLLIICDIVSVAHCALSVATDGPSVSILFGFEFAILLVTALSGLSMYHLHVVDGLMGFLHHIADGEHHYHAVGALAEPNVGEMERVEGIDEPGDQANNEAAIENVAPAEGSDRTHAPTRQKTLAKTLVERIANPWKNRRATLSFAIELQAQAAKFLFYVVFFAIVFTYYGMPINIFREVYVAFQQLRRRLIAFNNYRRLTHNMEKRFESIQDEEELHRLGHTCIICRDQMDLSGGCKKLPICGHAFHTHCLREWLVQQQSCPTCRADIAANEARRKRQLENEAANAAAAAEGEPIASETDDPGEIVAEAIEVADTATESGGSLETGQKATPADEPTGSGQQMPEEQSAKDDDQAAPFSMADHGALIPGWIEEWDPVSNRTYYWNKDTNETSWSRPAVYTDVLSQFNSMLHHHNANRDACLHERDIMQKRQNAVAASTVSHVNDVPCLYRIKNSLGALVFERHAGASKRVIPRGKIIVCFSVEYWPESRASMFRMPDGFVNSVDVEKFLELDMQSTQKNDNVRGVIVEAA